MNLSVEIYSFSSISTSNPFEKKIPYSCTITREVIRLVQQSALIVYHLFGNVAQFTGSADHLTVMRTVW